MLQLEDVFVFESDVTIAEKPIFESIFSKITSDDEYMNSLANLSDCEVKNILANNVLVYHASADVLYNFKELLEKASIAKSLEPVFVQYYMGYINANIDSILSDDIPCKYDFTEFPIKDLLFRAAIFEYHNYFAKVSETVTAETFAIMDNLSKHNIENITKVMSNLYSFMSSRRFEVDFEEQQAECTRLCKEYKVTDIYKSFQIVINCFDLFPFKYDKFKAAIKIKINDPDFDDIEIQRRYLISTLRKDSSYDRIAAQINIICNDYGNTMKKIETEVANEEANLRKLYEGNDKDVEEYINNLNIN